MKVKKDLLEDVRNLMTQSYSKWHELKEQSS